MSEEELMKIIKDIIARTGAKSQADMGKVMGVATKNSQAGLMERRSQVK